MFHVLKNGHFPRFDLSLNIWIFWSGRSTKGLPVMFWTKSSPCPNSLRKILATWSVWDAWVISFWRQRSASWRNGRIPSPDRRRNGRFLWWSFDDSGTHHSCERLIYFYRIIIDEPDIQYRSFCRMPEDHFVKGRQGAQRRCCRQDNFYCDEMIGDSLPGGSILCLVA